METVFVVVRVLGLFVAVCLLVGAVVEGVRHIPYAVGFLVRWCADGYREGRGK